MQKNQYDNYNLASATGLIPLSPNATKEKKSCEGCTGCGKDCGCKTHKKP